MFGRLAIYDFSPQSYRTKFVFMTLTIASYKLRLIQIDLTNHHTLLLLPIMFIVTYYYS